MNSQLVIMSAFMQNILSMFLRRFVQSDVKIKRQYMVNINKLRDQKTYRGYRHIFCLPVRGQRTRTNARTQKRKRLQNK